MRGVFERIVRGIAVVALLVVLVVPAAYGEGELDTGLDARMRPPIGLACPPELTYLEWTLLWAEMGVMSTGF